MKLLSTHRYLLAVGAISASAMFPAHAGSSEEAMQASLQQYKSVASGTEWHNVWMPQAAANAPAAGSSGDQLMVAIVAGYTRSILDRGGWENALMTNSHYTADNPLMAVGVGSGATTPVAEHMEIPEQLAAL